MYRVIKMPACKCNCGGCSKKGGMFSLDLMHETGGYTYDELKELWGDKYYEYLLDIYVKLVNNLEGCSKLVKLVLNIVSILSFKTIDNNDLRKLYDLYELKPDITIHNVNYLHQALIDNVRMEPFFVLRLSNCYNFVYSKEFSKELLQQNQSEYELYGFYMKLLGNEQYSSDYQVASSSLKSSIVSYFSGNNLEFIKNPLNWGDMNFRSAHVMLLKEFEDETKVLMLAHLPSGGGFKSSKKGSSKALIETDCRLGPPGGVIDKGETPWDAMTREYKEETGVDLPVKIELINTFIWKKNHIVFVVKTISRIVEGKVNNNDEIYSRKLFTIEELRKIIKDSEGPQVKGKFKMRNGAIKSTLAILDALEL